MFTPFGIEIEHLYSLLLSGTNLNPEESNLSLFLFLTG
jgi:hypothetical protein